MYKLFWQFHLRARLIFFLNNNSFSGSILFLHFDIVFVCCHIFTKINADSMVEATKHLLASFFCTYNIQVLLVLTSVWTFSLLLRTDEKVKKRCGCEQPYAPLSRLYVLLVVVAFSAVVVVAAAVVQ